MILGLVFSFCLIFELVVSPNILLAAADTSERVIQTVEESFPTKLACVASSKYVDWEKEREIASWKSGKEVIIWGLFIILCVSLYVPMKYGMTHNRRGRLLKTRKRIFGPKEPVDPDGCGISIFAMLVTPFAAWFVLEMIIEQMSVILCLSIGLGLIALDVLLYKIQKREKEVAKQEAYKNFSVEKKVNYLKEIEDAKKKEAEFFRSRSSMVNQVKNSTTSGISSIKDVDLLRLALAIVMSDGCIDENEAKSVKRLFAKCKNFDVNAEYLRQLEKLKKQGNPLQYVLATTAIPRDKSLLEKLIEIAGADGVFSEDEKNFLSRLATKMGVSGTELQAMIDNSKDKK